MEEYPPRVLREDLRIHDEPYSRRLKPWNYLCLGLGVGTLAISLYLMKNPEFLESFLFRKSKVVPISLETDPLTEKGTNNIIASLESKVSQNNLKSKD